MIDDFRMIHLTIVPNHPTNQDDEGPGEPFLFVERKVLFIILIIILQIIPVSSWLVALRPQLGLYSYHFNIKSV